MVYSCVPSFLTNNLVCVLYKNKNVLLEKQLIDLLKGKETCSHPLPFKIEYNQYCEFVFAVSIDFRILVYIILNGKGTSEPCWIVGVAKNRGMHPLVVPTPSSPTTHSSSRLAICLLASWGQPQVCDVHMCSESDVTSRKSRTSISSEHTFRSSLCTEQLISEADRMEEGISPHRPSPPPTPHTPLEASASCGIIIAFPKWLLQWLTITFRVKWIRLPHRGTWMGNFVLPCLLYASLCYICM